MNTIVNGYTFDQQSFRCIAIPSAGTQNLLALNLNIYKLQYYFTTGTVTMNTSTGSSALKINSMTEISTYNHNVFFTPTIWTLTFSGAVDGLFLIYGRSL